MEKLRNNSRLIVAGLITAGVLALVVSGGNKNSETKTDQTEETTQSQSTEEASMEKKEPAEVDNPIGSPPTAGPVSVDKKETDYNATVRKGDNQTVIVRQMVNEYLQDNSQSLSAEQRLFVETTVVNALPRNDVVFEGQEITVSETTLSSAVEASGQLTEAQRALWAQYL
ncbi:hypothetical protein KC992_04265 [Candidatus Saccharibacteria bacterium]|nr:hypothetical protein [Candidatus Saccharibacteria bacterium]MCA9328911.1 hypothetical protein [Candidatus Saccharibacteria bacterium]